MPTWVKLDDTCPEHPAMIGLSDSAFACWVRGLCYASRLLTDGFIPRTALRRLGTAKAARELEQGGRWVPVDGGWQVHGYEEKQRTRAQVEQEREKWRDRQHRHRTVTAPSRRDTPESHSGVTPPETETETETEKRPTTPPHNFKQGGSDPGGGDLYDEAARLLAEAEVSRRGGEIGNPSGYVQARIVPIRRTNETAWRALVAVDPTMSAADLAQSTSRHPTSAPPMLEQRPAIPDAHSVMAAVSVPAEQVAPMPPELRRSRRAGGAP